MSHTIKGYVKFSFDTYLQNSIGIPNVQVVLLDTSINKKVAAITDSSGYFEFKEVPHGNYQLIESYGFTPAYSSPVDFTSVTSLSSRSIDDNISSCGIAKDPPIGLIDNNPFGNTVFSLTPNTINIDTSSMNVDNISFTFIDTSYLNVPIPLDNFSLDSTNLISNEDNGNFRVTSPYTPENTNSTGNPLNIPAYNFEPLTVSKSLNEGSYTKVNICSLYDASTGYMNFADHTSNCECGNLLLLATSNTRTFFVDIISNLQENTTYLLSFYTALVTKNSPLLTYKIRVYDANDILIIDAPMSSKGNHTKLEWNQLGYLINTENNTTLKIELYTEVEIQSNSFNSFIQFVVDDISFNKLIEKESILSLLIEGKPIIEDSVLYIDYKINLQNNISIPLKNIILYNTLPEALSLVPDSSNYNNTPITGDIFPFSIENLEVGLENILTFRTQVIGKLEDEVCNLIRASYNYEYHLAPYSLLKREVSSNESKLLLSTGKLEVIKSIDRDFCTVDDEVLYTISITSEFADEFSNLAIIDTIPSELSFVNDSLTINGVSIPGGTIASSKGLKIGDLTNNKTIVITYLAKVISVPYKNQITNNAIVHGVFLDGDVYPPVSFTSNTTTLTVKNLEFSSTLMVSKSIAEAGDKLGFTLQVKNIGNITATGVTSQINLPSGFELDSSSILINKTQAIELSNENNETISLPDLLPDDIVVVNFTVNVLNPSYGAYKFECLISGTQIQKSYEISSFSLERYAKTTPSIIITIGSNYMEFIKYVDKNYCQVGEILTYTLVLKNLPTSSTAIRGTLFDRTPIGTEYIPQSLRVNCLPSNLESPGLGVPFGSIPKGSSSTITYCVITRCHSSVENSAITIVEDPVVGMVSIISNKVITCVD